MIKNNRYWKVLVVLAAFVVSTNYFCSEPAATEAKSTTEPTVEKKPLTKAELLEKGSYRVRTAGCNDCHTPKKMTAEGPVPDESRMLSGFPAGTKLPDITYDATKPGNWILFGPELTAAVGPWGITFSANLTPDSTTGLGAWTTEMFIKTMRTGKHMGQEGGRPILPPMPWNELKNMTDEDLTAIFTFLQSIPAIKNQVPAPVPPNEVKIKKA